MKKPIPIGVLVFVILACAVFLLDTGLEASNQESFCISCHAMRSTVYREYKESGHFSNSTGVRATCSDCHVPRSMVAKIGKKILAVKDIYHTLIGTVDSKEKFEARRRQLARRVWREMRANDSQACRNCHKTEYMLLGDQDKTARKKHLRMLKQKLTCIDCHRGITHELPREEAVATMDN